MILDHSKYQDQITAILDFWQSKKEIDKLSMPQRETILGLKFSQGEKVTDTVTGEEVEIIGGIREIVGVPGPGG